MNKIYKYSIGYGRTVMMPKGSVVLSTIMQHGDIVVYAKANSKADEYEARKFNVYPTGASTGSDTEMFIGTVGTEGNDFVFHVFENFD